LTNNTRERATMQRRAAECAAEHVGESVSSGLNPDDDQLPRFVDTREHQEDPGRDYSQ
jgi:hypothetical protein